MRARLFAMVQMMALACAAALMSVPASANAPALDTVRFVYYWPAPDLLITPIAVGMQKGFYEKHGIKTAVILPPDAQTTGRLLASGQGDVGVEDSTDVIFAASISLPLISIGNYDQHNSWCMIGRPGEEIDLHGLKGKKIAIFADSWTALMMRSVIRRFGLGPNDMEQIMTQFDDFPLLLAKRIDLATSAVAFGIAATVDQTGKMPTLACRDATGVPDIPIWSFTATPAWLSSHGKTARAWMSATAEAMRWSVEHPTEAAKILVQTYPSLGSQNYAIVGWTSLATNLAGPDGYLHQTDAHWNALAQDVKDDRQIPDVKPASTYYTNDYLPR